jgi:hypothetical protein
MENARSKVWQSKRIAIMEIRRKIIRRIVIDFACVLTLCLTLIVWQASEASGLTTQIEKALEEQELLIDYSVEGDTAYAFVSTTGDTKYGDRFLVFNRKKDGGWSRSYENDFAGLKPWRLRISDIDGDGEREILTAVYKSTFYDEEERNRLFIFGYTKGKLIKKWTGSEIAGSWETFIAGDLVDTKGEEIIFISRTNDGKEKLMVYYWFDFGFLLLAQSEAYEDIVDVMIQGENRLLITYTDGSGRKTEQVQLKEGTITRLD